MSDYWKEMQAGPKSAMPPQLKVLVPTNESLVRRTGAAATTMWLVIVISAINLILVHLHAPIRFDFGFMLTDLIYAIALGAASAIPNIGGVFSFGALAVNLFILGGLAFCGWRAKRKATWAIVASLVFVVLDIGAIAWFTSKTMDLPLIALFVHGVVIYTLVLGLRASRLYDERKKNGDIP